MKALEVETFTDSENYADAQSLFRALVWDIDEETGLRLLIDICECEDAAYAVEAILERNPDVTLAKYKEQIEQPDAISVGEAARAMAGVW